MQSFNRNSKGFTLIELLIGLAVIGISIVAIVGASRSSSEASRIQTEIKNLKVIQQSLRTSFASSGSYSQLTNTVALKSGAFPVQMVNGTIVRNSWGDLVSAEPNANSAFFDITYNDVSTSSCIKLVPQVVSEFYSVKIGSTVNVAKDWGSTNIVDACSSSALVTILFTGR